MVDTYFGGRFLLYYSKNIFSRKSLLFCYLILWGKRQLVQIPWGKRKIRLLNALVENQQFVAIVAE